MTRKEFHHITRDMRTLFLVTIAPSLALFLLAQVFSRDVERFNLIVLDQDRTDLSRRYVEDVISDGTFRLVADAANLEDIDAQLQTGQANLALVIPHNTAAKLEARDLAPVQVIVDGVDAVAGSQAIGQLQGRTAAFGLTLLAGIPNLPSGMIDLRQLAWYNPSLKSVYGMVPGLFAVVLTVPALALSLSLAREKEMGSFEGLVATPIRGLEYLMGKMLAYAALGTASMLPVVLVAAWVYRVPFNGSPFVLFVLVLCYYAASFGMGLVVAGLVKSQQTAMLIMILLFFVPSFFLAGLTTPVNTHSPVSYAFSSILPATHFITICRGVFLKGLGFAELAAPATSLVTIGIVSLTVGVARFRKWID
jgi:ABC-2 type transport system permease protein